MCPPGGGRNEISSRFMRHLSVISVADFDDSTLSKIFSSICDWHFGKGFETEFLRLGKVNKPFSKILFRVFVKY